MSSAMSSIDLGSSISRNTNDREEVNGILFDANYDISFAGNSMYPVIHLKVYSDRKGLIDVEYRKFKPYGLFELDDFADEDLLKRRLLTHEHVVGVESTKRKKMSFPHPTIRLLKVEFDIPKSVGKYREEIESYEGISRWHECDIKFIRRFVIDEDIDFMRNVDLDLRVVMDGREKTYVLDDMSKMTYNDYANPMDINVKMVTFDIEVLNPDVSVDPKEDPVIIIGASKGRLGKEHEYRVFRLDEYEGNGLDAERNMIMDFCYWLSDYDPYFITTYNGTYFDIDYLADRCDYLDINFDVIADGDGGIYINDRGFANRSVNISGRVNNDMYLTSDRDMRTPDKSLKTVADHLGVLEHEDRIEIPGEMIYDYWESGGVKREVLVEYCIDDVRATKRLAEGTLFLINTSISRICHVPYSEALGGGYGSVDSQLLNVEYSERGFVLPRKKHESDRSFTGAKVNVEVSGYFYDVDCLDFASMYPSIAKRDGMSHETYLGDVDPNELDVEYSEIYIDKYDIVHRFNMDYDDAVLPQVIDYFFDERGKYKGKWKKLPEDDPKKDVYDTLQYTYKRLVNTLYGMTGANIHRYYFLPIAESITAEGRRAIDKIFMIARDEFDKEVYYGDTDSAYLQGFGTPEERKSGEEIDERNEYLDRVKEETGLDIELDYQIPVMVLFGRKKRYFFSKREDDGTLSTKIKGLELVRGDTPPILDKQKDVIDLLLKDVLLRSKEEGVPIDDYIDVAIDEVNEMVEALRDGEMGVEDLVVSTSLSKPLDEYDEGHGQQHAAVAEKELMEYDNMVFRKGNEKIPWVMVKPDKVDKYYPSYFDTLTEDDLDDVCTRAVLAHRVDDPNDIDVRYYRDTIVRTFGRIFEGFGVNEKSLSAAETDPEAELEKIADMM